MCFAALTVYQVVSRDGGRVMHVPLHDWQFWVVTALVGGVALLAFRRLIPKKRAGTRATLTISAPIQGGRKSG